jgi:hypothetical protein
VIVATVPVDPSREQARGWAVDELSRREYQANQPGLVERGIRWLLDQLDHVHLRGNPGPSLALGITVVLLAAVIGYAIWRAGGLGRQARRPSDDALFAGQGPLLPAEHRAAADRAAAAQDWNTAVLERFRAVVRELEERTVLVPQPGRTADEAARAGGHQLPDLAAALAAGARTFDDVRYGDRPGTAQGDAQLRALDTAVRRSRASVIG